MFLEVVNAFLLRYVNDKSTRHLYNLFYIVNFKCATCDSCYASGYSFEGSSRSQTVCFVMMLKYTKDLTEELLIVYCEASELSACPNATSVWNQEQLRKLI